VAFEVVDRQGGVSVGERATRMVEEGTLGVELGCWCSGRWG
jgi:hypothetical protein